MFYYTPNYIDYKQDFDLYMCMFDVKEQSMI